MDHDISATEIGRSSQADRAACMESCLLEDKCRSVIFSMKHNQASKRKDWTLCSLGLSLVVVVVVVGFYLHL